MALKDRIKGLDQHKIDLPPATPAVAPQPVVSVDISAADELMSSVWSTISSSHQPGCFDWLLENRKDVTKALADLEQQVDAAYREGNIGTLKKALDILERSYAKAFEIFNLRPPVFERQEEMFL